MKRFLSLSQVSADDERRSTNEPELEGMAGALAKALAARSAHIQVSGEVKSSCKKCNPIGKKSRI